MFDFLRKQKTLDTATVTRPVATANSLLIVWDIYRDGAYHRTVTTKKNKRPVLGHNESAVRAQ